ncbi:phage tail sheath family protein [Pseudodesulfovibrio thermohalotolerans]|uniref:phage tail sheath family protein n=1 Tax=Pseudodesulfovibrio thermohalotolerans TaxID=2880651 RepID=UPI002442B064|nr:phage tail sheath family protein [Pseudodesulfovibrio thermohalotolerans]WFS63457.1 phage tail sheath family protein [Pseudodesulfovibrio thermohalotolerans]
MTYEHRVKTSEVPTQILPPRRISAGVPVVIGTAPVEDLADKPVNEPRVIYSYSEFVATFGWSDDWDKYTLCEFAYSHFALFGVAPIVCINVYDPASHQSGDPAAGDPTQVVSADIIGGIDADTGARTGLELVADVFPRYRLVPGQIVAPKWSEDPSVAIVMEAKAERINGLFNAMAVIDIPDGTVTRYTDVPAYKEANNLTGKRMIDCWGKPYMGDMVFHGSTMLAGRICLTDADHDDVPYVSPSNKRIKATGAKVNGRDLYLGLEEAEYLNGQGVVLFFNFDGGWKAWGNRTAAYPSVTDPKDAFIPIRRFFNWHGNTFILTYWQLLDNPLNRRQIETIMDSEQIRLNGFTSREYILGGRIAFLEDENPTTDLMDGISRFHTYMTPPSPNRVIENILEYDATYVSALFGG